MTAPAVLRPALDPAALRAARRAARLTLEDVAALVGRDFSVIARYERGEVDPPSSVVGALAGLYRVDVGSLFTQ